MTESVREYMERRQREARDEEQKRRYRMVANSKEAEELQRRSVEMWERAARHWRKLCGLQR